MKENTFTPGERLQLRQSLLELYRNKDIRPSSKDARQLWTLMELALEKEPPCVTLSASTKSP